MLIAYKAWQHRKFMSQYLGAARRRTAVEKVLTLLIESGFVYMLLYTLQAVPIYGAKLSSSGLIAFNVVNAVIQQAMGIYPTSIIVLVRMQKSLWDTTEVSEGIQSSTLKFKAARNRASGRSAGATETAVSDYPANEHGNQVAMVDLNPPIDQQSSEFKKETNSFV